MPASTIRDIYCGLKKAVWDARVFPDRCKACFPGVPRPPPVDAHSGQETNHLPGTILACVFLQRFQDESIEKGVMVVGSDFIKYPKRRIALSSCGLWQL